MKKTLKSKPFIIFYIATLIVTTYYAMRISNEFQNEKIVLEDYVDSTTDLLSDAVSIWFEQNIKLLETIAIDFAAIQDPEEIQSIIEAQQNNLSSVLMYIGLEDNTFISTDEDLEREGMDTFVPTERPWYTEAMSMNGEVVVSEPYIDFFNGNTTITFSKYMGKIEGKDAVVAFDVNVDELFTMVSEASYEFIDYFFLVDSAGGIAYHPNEEFMPNEEGTVSIHDIPGYESLAGKSKEESSATLVTDFDGEEKYLMNSAVESVGWQVVAVVDPSVIYSQFTESITKSFPIYMIVIILFLSAAVIYRRNEQLKIAKDEMLISNSLYDAAISNLDIFIFDYDIQTRTVRNSPSMCKAFGIGEELKDFPNCFISSGIISSDDRKIILSATQKSLEDEKDISFRIEMCNALGDVSMHNIKLDGIYNSKGELSRIIGIIENISNVVELEIKSSQDLMTGLLNKHTALQKIDKILEKTGERECALFVIDIDDFKTINDSFGHAVGDIAIKKTADVIKSLFRESDILCRYGGDEFLVLANGMHALEAIEKADGLKRQLHRVCEDHEYKITLSIGIAIAPGHGKDFTELFESADKALYRAKVKGKNTYAIY